jgi:hypothetical protein
MNKYNKWYAAITSRGQNRQLTTYTESHHILPKSLGGTDLPNNITNLTAREHFICHWLLTKIYREGEEHWKMINALRIMRAENKNQRRYENKITARVYENLKQEYAKLQSIRVKGKNNPMYGKRHSTVAKKRIGDANRGRVQPIEEKNKQKQAMLGRKREPFSEEWRAKMSAKKAGDNNPMFSRSHTESTKELMRQKALGRKQSAETIANKAAAIKGIKREKKQCPHCQQTVAVNGYARWHGDNCKQAGN